MSAIDFTEDYQRRMTRLRATYTSAGQFDHESLLNDLFTGLFYAKLDKSLQKAMHPFISTLEPTKFTLDELAGWVDRNVTMADHGHTGRKNDIAAVAIYGEPEDDDTVKEIDGTAYVVRNGKQ